MKGGVEKSYPQLKIEILSLFLNDHKALIQFIILRKSTWPLTTYI
jgi:hypothetical protein